MRKLFFCLILYCCSLRIASAQEIKGSVKDTAEKTSLHNASIVILRQQDSVMISCTRAGYNGEFMFSNISKGKYLLMISYPQYADYVNEIEVSKPTEDLGEINLTLKSQLLAEVVVMKKLGAIHIKGDTIEFKADSFYTASGATVEALLKKLPGIEVDKDGRITAQGESVKKVLVDGEEFFSDDPTIVTRGMTADVVDKVQLYNKSSDQAEFTGIRDGKETKTIDLKLKESAKKGYFGKVEAASNANNFWNNNAMLNAFKGKRKLSAYGKMSSTKLTRPEMDLGDIGGLEDYTGLTWGEGFPKSWTSGLQYSNKWQENKTHLNTGYKYDRFNIESSGTVKSQYILPDTLYNVNQKGNSFSSANKNGANGRFDWQIDSLSSIRVGAIGVMSNSVNYSNDFTESLDQAGQQVNSSTRTASRNTDQKMFSTDFRWRQKFRKTGRTFSFSIWQTYSNASYSEYLNSDNRFFKDKQEKSSQLIDQQKRNDNTSSRIYSSLTYTEPLSPKSILEFEYDIDNNNRDSRRTTQNKDIDGRYTERVDSLSNDFMFKVVTHTAGAHYRYGKTDRFNFSFGVNASQADYNTKNLKLDSTSKYQFTNVYPQAELQKSLGAGGNLRVKYEGSTQAPSLEQVQPVADNTDPLNIRIGNPNLKQAFTHNMSLNYDSYKLLSETGLSLNTDLSTVQNDFSEMNTVDSFGRRIYRPVNVSGNYHARAGINYYRTLKRPHIRVGMSMDINKDHNVSFVNDVKSRNDNVACSFGPNLSYDKEKQYMMVYWSRIAYNTLKSSVRAVAATRYWTQSHWLNATAFLPWKLELSSDCNLEIRQKTVVFDKNNNMLRWNARIDRKIFKKDAARVGIAAYDMLNQGKGVYRNISNNFITERQNTNIRRYIMMTFSWNFKNQMTNEAVE